MKKRLVSITLATTMLLSLTACGSGNSGGAAGTAAPAAPETTAAGSGAGSEAGSEAAAEGAEDYKGTVMLYSSTDEGVIIALKEAFETKYPNVTLDYYAATSGKCVTKLATEFQSGTVACDLAWLADPSAMITLKDDGNLLAYKSPYAEGIDGKFKDADGYYSGARLLLMGVTFSTTTCSDEEAPTNYDGFLGESFKDQIVMTDPTGSGSTKALVYALTNNSNYGWEYFVSA